MQENIEINNLETSLNNIKQLTEKLTHSVNNINALIEENINSGIRVWDSESASRFRARWDNMMEEIPMVIETFKAQEANLENVIKSATNIKEGK